MTSLSGEGIRTAFLDYFEARGHRRVSSSALVPQDDPTLLFTNAGMVQFKDVFTGRARLPFTRATTAQRCLRAGGKHNDLDHVGRTPRHHTFFEMLGNFSFGDYFKGEAIGFAWELLTGPLGLPPERLWVTVFQDDDEAAGLWRAASGLPAERVVRLGEKDNFWAMGDTGPCGPCSEVVYDRGARFACGRACGIGRCDCDRWLEIWNLVFMQFERAADGTVGPLPRPSIDTGMGLERVAAVLQGVESNYETDLFRPLIAAVEHLSGRLYDPGPQGFAFRVIADHGRACAALVADGVLPGNEDRGYVLRRILRRAARLGRTLGLRAGFLADLVPVVATSLGPADPELADRAQSVAAVIRQEEERFDVTLAEGLERLEAALAAVSDGVLPGAVAFRLHDTYGFPLDLTEDAAAERGVMVDRAGFEEAMAAQRRRARADRRRRGHTFTAAEVGDLAPTEFVGYDVLEAQARVVAVLAGGEVVLDRTPFYAEGGGQVGDAGSLGGWCVADTRRTPRGVFLHVVQAGTGVAAGPAAMGGAGVAATAAGAGATGPAGTGDAAGARGATVVAEVVADATEVALGLEGAGCETVGDGLEPGVSVPVRVDAERRRAVMRNHTATHLLHRALREVLGAGVHQAGSLVAPDRLRFDFTYDRPIDAGSLGAIESLVNTHVLAALPVETFESDLASARAMGAMALFGEKYGERVRVVRMGDWSLELCGGTHVANTAQVGLFHLVSEAGVGSGTRRVEAVTGTGVLALLRRREAELREAAGALRVEPGRLAERAAGIAERLVAAEQRLAAAERARAAQVADDLVARASDVEGVRIATGEVVAADADALRRLADELRRRLGSGGVLLTARTGDRALLLCALTPDLVARGLHAGRVVARAAEAAGGTGGGRADLAQAGARDPARLPEAVAAGLGAVREQLRG